MYLYILLQYILNTIIFSAKVGLEVNGAADYVTGVHVWFVVAD